MELYTQLLGCPVIEQKGTTAECLTTEQGREKKKEKENVLLT